MLKKIENKTLNERAYEELRAGLTAGRFEPAQPFIVRALAEAYGISATPIREALQRLVAERILEVQPNRSIMVPPMTEERYAELLMLRIELEGLATQLAAQRLAPRQIAALASLITKARKAIEKADSNAYFAVNRDFHFMIYESCGSPELIKLIQDLWLKCGPFLTRMFGDEHFREHANDQHDNILSALDRRDGAAARAYMVQDISDAAVALKKVMFK
ncbi:MAG: GntR family transcriptional regulator [Alphaproteobacteria bacterium]|nr:GntR family transcriptional regulator [Alphaproteobacteria bacterium]